MVSCGKIKLSTTPSKAASPIPDMEKLPHWKAAPPIPKVRMRETTIIFLVFERSTLFWIRLLMPSEAIVPKRSNMIPPSTGAGMDFKKALILPKIEKIIPVTAAIRMTAGLVTFVKETAPVTFRVSCYRGTADESGKYTGNTVTQQGAV